MQIWRANALGYSDTEPRVIYVEAETQDEAERIISNQFLLLLSKPRKTNNADAEGKYILRG
jgi:hypothetical protein